MKRQILSNSLTTFLTLATLLVTGPRVSAGDSNDAPTQDAPTDYMLIVTGGELLRGVYADGHTHFITRTLGPLGCRCVGAMCVGDDEEDLYQALAYSAERANLVIVTGGLGPTDDDITRETLSGFTGIPLREDPGAVKAMMRRFGVQSKSSLRKNLLRQTQTPVRGTYFPNPHGTAVGLVFENEDQVLVALPGPPRELQPMVHNELIPYLAKRFGIQSIGCSLTMRFVGIGESRIDEVMHEHLDLPDDLMISSLFELGRVDLTLSLPDDSPQEHARLKSLEGELLKHIGEYMYSDNGLTLEECVIQLLAKRGVQLVSAEVGSGGSVAASLNHAEGARSVYAGGYVAPSNRIMMRMLDLDADLDADSPVSADRLTHLVVQRICERTESKWGLAVSETIESNDNPSYVWVALGSPKDSVDTVPVSLRGHGETGKARLVNRCLDLLRRRLQQIEAQ